MTVDAYGTYTFRWTEDNNGCTDFDEITVNFNPLPLVTDPTPEFCEETEGSNNATVDLTALESDINSEASSAFTWFTNNDYQTGEITTGLSTYVVSNNQILYVEVENTITGCVNQTPVNFTVNPLPVANDLAKSLNETTANSGIAEDVDLNQYNTEVNINWEDAGYSIIWHAETSQGSGIKAGVVNIVDISDGERFIGVVNDPNNCENEAIIDFTINTIPDIQDPEPIYCEDTYASGSALANLNDIESSYGLSEVNYNFIWYEDSGLSQALANQEEQNVTSSSFFYLKVEDAGNSSIFNSTQVTFTVNSKPQAKDLSYTFCEETLGTLQRTLDLTSFHPEVNTATSGSYSFEWFTTADLNPTNQIAAGDLINYTVSDASSLYVLVTNDNTGCENSSEVSFTIVPQPQVSIASPTYEICETDIFEVTNIAADITIQDEASYEWTIVPGQGTGIITNKTTLTATYQPSATDIANGSFSLRLTATGNFDCASVSEDITVNITLAPTVNAGDDLTICEGDIVDFSTVAMTPSATEYASLLWESTSANQGTFSDDESLRPNYTPSADEITAGSATLKLSAIGNNSCANVEDQITITINPEPTVTTMTDFTICETEVINISGDFGGSVNAAEWQIVNGNGSIISESTTGSTVSAIYDADPTDIGSNVILKLISTSQDAPCDVVEDQLTITIKRAPIATAPTDFEICENENINLSGTIGGSATDGDWIITSGAGSIGTSTFTGTTVTATYTPASADFGNTVTFELVALDPEGESFCANNSDEVSVTIRTLPVVNAGSNSEICEYDDFNFADATTNASASNYNSIEWSTSGDGSFDNSSSLLPVYSPGPNDIINESVTLTLTAQSNNPTVCNAVSSNMTLTVKPQPVINTISPISLCPTDTQPEIALSSDLAGGAFTWTITKSDQLGLASSGNGNIPAFTAQENISGLPVTSIVTIHYELNGCIADQSTFEITTKPTPVTEQVDNISVCAGDLVEVNFEANTTGETFNWSNDGIDIGNGSFTSGNGTITFIADENISGSPRVSTFTYNATLDGCVSETKTFSVTLLPTPVFNTVADIEVCSFDNITTNFNTNVAGVSYSWTNDNTDTGIPANGSGNLNFSANENLTGADEVSNITVTATKGGCISAQETFQVIVKPKPIIVVQNDIEICPGDDISSILFSDNSSGNSTITWTATNASNIGLPASSGTSAIPAFTAATNNGTNVIVSTITATSTWDDCTSDQITFRIRLKPTPIMNSIPDRAFCAEDVVSTNFSNSLGAGTTYNWVNDNINIGLAASGTNDFNFTLPENKTGSAIVANISVTPENNGCIGPTEIFTITLNPTPVITSLPDIEVCSEEILSIPISTDLSNVSYSVSATDNSLFTSGPVVNNGNIEFTMAINTSGTDIVSNIILVAGKNNCENQEVFEVTLKNRPIVTPENDESPLCAGTNVPVRNFSHVVGGGTFSWEITEPDLIGDATPLTGNDDFPGFTLAENNTGLAIEGYVKYFSTSNGCESLPDSFKITLKPTPIIQNENLVFCDGEFVNIEFLDNVEGIGSYSWSIENVTQPTIGINNASGTTDPGSNTITSAGFTTVNNSETEDNIAIITVNSINNDCEGPIKTFEVRVLPIPTVTNSNFEPTTCSNDTFVFEPQSEVASVTFEWNLISGDSTIVKGLESNGTGDISLDLINTSSVNQIVNYEITPINGDCTGESEELTITVRPEVRFSEIETEYIVCSGQDFTLPLRVQNNLANIKYRWTVSDNNSGAKDSIATTVGGNLVNTIDGKSDTILYTITPLLDNGVCAGSSKTVRIIVNPNAIVEIDPVQNICQGESITLNAVLSNGAESGTWSGGSGEFSSSDLLTTVYTPAPSEYGEDVTLRFTTNDPEGPCGEVFDEITFTVNTLPEIEILNDPFPNEYYCVDNGEVELVGSEEGGIFSGNDGVIERDGKYYFDPEDAGVGGPYRVFYSYTNENNCESTVETRVTVSNGLDAEFETEVDDNGGYFCANGRILLEPEEDGGTFEGPGLLITGNSTYFDPTSEDVIGLDSVTITYRISESEASCVNSSSKIFIRIPEPNITLDYQNVCGTDNAVQVTINPGYNTDRDELFDFELIYNNSELSVDANGIIQFSSPGEKDIIIIGTTALGCQFETDTTIIVGNIQEVNFSATNLKTTTQGETPTQFNDESIIDIINSDSTIHSIKSYLWDFGVDGVDTDTSSLQNPTFNYEIADAYDVRLIIETNLNCYDTITKTINIVPAINTYPYLETFDNTTGGWYTTSDIGSSSWIHDFPNGAFEGQNDNKEPGEIWKTAAYPDSIPSGYLENENSFLVGPTFDLSSLEKPMISFDMWLDVEDERFEGAIVEYSTDGRKWEVFGGENDVLNWYNVTNNSPIGGDSSNTDNLAWYFTGNERNWVRVAHVIDNGSIGNLSNVSFRINFRGDRFSGTPDGMAIDNFYVGERQKLVLLEKFTNLNSSDYSAKKENVQILMDSEIGKDVLPLNYHISSPSPDPINARNPIQLDSRAASYSIEESSKIMIDGKPFDNSIINSDGNSLNEDFIATITRQSLLEPSGLINVTIDEIDDEHTIRFTALHQPNEQNKEDIIVYFFIVEKSAETSDGSFTNIVRKIIPNINGLNLNDLDEGSSITYDWEVNSIYTNDELAVVSVIQNQISKEILEVMITDINSYKSQAEITSIKENIGKLGMKLYPNPSRGLVNITFTQPLKDDIDLMIFDIKGALVKHKNVKAGLQSEQFDLKGISSGVYHIISKDGEGNLNRMKLVIID
ncbi:PKD-like domain-containing protein [Marivirga sp.]|uniref:PKD-like domain-containing protein n=1 Tax=Marivirga sp. TaxID=2018662 RepID=UPI002D7FC98F|nr:PKD-like domain-containing protein [Marivirga sp.]HET8858650.1 PKD-like domain-containing protein [Marivirga sp.]